MNEGRPSGESAPAPKAELFNPSANVWGDVKEGVLELEEQCFPGQGLPEKELEIIFSDPANIVVVLKKDTDLIGFSCAIPDEDVEEATYIYATDIHPDEQGMGHVVSIMNVLEEEARKRGYKFLTRNAAVPNGYADKIQKNYKGRILESHENNSEYGPQRYFKIRL